MKPKVSVIVPVYNTENYLRECVESILAQTLKEIEIILVDDGSTDKCGQMCDEYADKYASIKVIHLENGGELRARRIGVEAATGEYIGFVDSDDYISEEMYKVLYEYVESTNADVVSCNLQCDDGRLMHNRFPQGLYQEEQLVYLFKNMIYSCEVNGPAMLQSACTKLIRRSLLKIVYGDVDEGITNGEDAVIVYLSSLLAKRIFLADDCLYYYRQRIDSQCNSLSEKYFEKIFRWHSFMIKQVSRFDSSWKLPYQVKQYSFNMLRAGMSKLFDISLSEYFYLENADNYRGKKVCLYGAGMVGRFFRKQICDVEGFVCHWIDKGKAGQEIDGFCVEGQAALNRKDFDLVLIAVAHKNVADQIMQEIKKFDILPDRIVWSQPVNSHMYYLDI